MASKHYLTRKVQPGEIQPQADPILAARALAEADSLVAYGIRRGLLSYPAGTKFDDDGRPIPKLFTPERTYTKPVEDYPCLRAYLLADNGMPHVQVAKAIKASSAKVGAIIAHGKALYLAQRASLTPSKGGQAASQTKRASGQPANGAGPCRGRVTTPQVGTLRPKSANAGAKADLEDPERKPKVNL